MNFVTGGLIVDPAFVIDPIGGDDYNGTGLPGNPVQTAARLYAIWTSEPGSKPALMPFGGRCTVTFMSAPIVGDPVAILANVQINGTLLIVGPAPTVVVTDTISAVTSVRDRTQAGAAPWKIQGTGVVDYSPHINRALINTTKNTLAWIAVSTNGNVQAQLTEPSQQMPPPNFIQIPIAIAPAAGDTYQIVTFTPATFGSDIYAQTLPGKAHFGTIVFYRWNFVNDFSSWNVQTDSAATTVFSECLVDESLVLGNGTSIVQTFFNIGLPRCVADNLGKKTKFLGGGSSGGMQVDGFASFDGDFYFRDGQSESNQGMLTVRNGQVSLGLVAFFSTLALQGNALCVRENGSATIEPGFYATAVMYGIMQAIGPTIGRCISVAPGGVVEYTSPATTSIGFAPTTGMVVGNNAADVRSASFLFKGGYKLSQLGANNAIFSPSTGAYLGPVTNPPIGFNPITQLIPGAGIFGDGSDGPAVFDSAGGPAPAGSVRDNAITFHLTRDVFYTDCEVQDGVTVNTRGFKTRCTGQFSIFITGATFYADDGLPGVSGNGGGAGGAGAPSGTLLGGTAGGAGGLPGLPGMAAANVTQGVSDSMPTTGAGGNGGAGTSAGGLGGTYTPVAQPTGILRALPEIDYWATPKLTGKTLNLVPYEGGAGGGGGGSSATNTGGGGGGGAGTVWIAASIIEIAGGATISAQGGSGNAGDLAGATATGGGGGGGGGTVVLVSTQIADAVTNVSGGTGGPAGGPGGVAGAPGAPGNVFLFLIQ